MKKVIFFTTLILAITTVSCSLGEDDVRNASLDVPGSSNDIPRNLGVIPQDTTQPVTHDVTSGMSDDKLQIDAKVIDSIPQLDFCACIVKQKELETKVLNAQSTEEEDKALKDMEGLTNSECAKLLRNTFSTTLDEENYKKRIQECLNN